MLPDWSQFNRQIRTEWETLVAVGHQLAARLDAGEAVYEVLDATAAPVRTVKARDDRMPDGDGTAVACCASIPEPQRD